MIVVMIIGASLGIGMWNLNFECGGTGFLEKDKIMLPCVIVHVGSSFSKEILSNCQAVPTSLQLLTSSFVKGIKF